MIVCMQRLMVLSTVLAGMRATWGVRALTAPSSSSPPAIPLKSTPHGVVAVHKPIGWTSSDVVSKVKRILIEGEKAALGIPKGIRYKTKTKVGHGGTLDPLAEGVLVLGIGKGTKLLQGYLSGDKGYSAVALLGEERDTQDCTGVLTVSAGALKSSNRTMKDRRSYHLYPLSSTPPHPLPSTVLTFLVYELSKIAHMLRIKTFTMFWMSLKGS